MSTVQGFENGIQFDNLTLTKEEADILTPDEWCKVALSLTGQFYKAPAFAEDKLAALHKWFGSDMSRMTHGSRLIMKRYAVWRRVQAEKVPACMVREIALANGQQPLMYTDKMVIPDPEAPREVPASRVPLPVEDLIDGKARKSSDIIALSLGAMTRWDGKAVKYTWAAEDISTRVQFLHIDITNIDVLLPYLMEVTTSATGMKGRTWTFAIMRWLQTIPLPLYLALADMWTRAVFKLDVIVKTRVEKTQQGRIVRRVIQKNVKPQLSKKLDQFVTIVTHVVKTSQAGYPPYDDEKAFAIPDFKANPAHLREIARPWQAPKSQVEMYSHHIQFMQMVQSRTVGIGMVLNAAASWGFSSVAHVKAEYIVSLLTGIGTDIVIEGLTDTELSLVRASVQKWSNYKVYAYVSELEADGKLKMAKISNEATLVSIMHDDIPRDATVQKTGAAKSYVEAEVESRVWDVYVRKQSALAAVAKRWVIMGAMIPSAKAVFSGYYVYRHRPNWDGAAVLSNIAGLKYGVVSARALGDEKASITHFSLEVKEYPTYKDPADFYEHMIRAMNAAPGMTVISAVPRNSGIAGLLYPASLKANNVAKWTYDETYGEWQATYRSIDEEIKRDMVLAEEEQVFVDDDGEAIPQDETVIVNDDTADAPVYDALQLPDPPTTITSAATPVVHTSAVPITTTPAVPPQEKKDLKKPPGKGKGTPSVSQKSPPVKKEKEKTDSDEMFISSNDLFGNEWKE